jgi:hypothetical protein
MKWYDYSFCFFCADLISAGIVNYAPIPFLFGVLAYLSWENYREWEVKNGK